MRAIYHLRGEGIFFLSFSVEEMSGCCRSCVEDEGETCHEREARNLVDNSDLLLCADFLSSSLWPAALLE